jgi:hypothetical protein
VLYYRQRDNSTEMVVAQVWQDVLSLCVPIPNDYFIWT